MDSVTIQEFKKMVERPEITNKKNQDKMRKKLEGKEVGRVVKVDVEFDTGGYLLAIATLAKKYKEVEAILIGKEYSFFYVA